MLVVAIVLAMLLLRDETSSPEIERLEIDKVVLGDFRPARLPEVTRAAIARAHTYEVDPEFGTVTPFVAPLVVRVALAPADARTRECRVARGEAGADGHVDVREAWRIVYACGIDR
jgi:hypothetical protein